MTGKRGRPGLDPRDRSVTVTVAMPARRYEVLYARAAVDRVTVPELIRRALELQYKTSK